MAWTAIGGGYGNVQADGGAEVGASVDAMNLFVIAREDPGINRPVFVKFSPDRVEQFAVFHPDNRRVGGHLNMASFWQTAA